VKERKRSGKSGWSIQELQGTNPKRDTARKKRFWSGSLVTGSPGHMDGRVYA